jgi:hypothetical protein
LKEQQKKVTYTNSKKQPIFGTGQGISHSPIIWLFLSDVLDKKIHLVATGGSYISNNPQAVPFYLSTYVDNVHTHYTTTQNIQELTVKA